MCFNWSTAYTAARCTSSACSGNVLILGIRSQLFRSSRKRPSFSVIYVSNFVISPYPFMEDMLYPNTGTMLPTRATCAYNKEAPLNEEEQGEKDDKTEHRNWYAMGTHRRLFAGSPRRKHNPRLRNDCYRRARAGCRRQ